MKTKAKTELPDDENPLYLYATVDSKLLCQIAKGEINPTELAKKELENRGLDFNGKWVGFRKSYFRVDDYSCGMMGNFVGIYTSLSDAVNEIDTDFATGGGDASRPHWSVTEFLATEPTMKGWEQGEVIETYIYNQ